MAHILVVDDDRDLTAACDAVLKKAGHRTTQAHAPDEAMEALRRDPPDLLILDIMMNEPDDGFRMARELRREGFAKPILMLTGVARVAGVPFGPDADVNPVDDYAEKPLPPAVLIRKVNELLQKKVRSTC